MAYFLSATKLKSYAQCPKAYYFRYEYGLRESGAFGAATLGSALHGALAQLYGEWHYEEPLPTEAWIRQCWDGHIGSLSPEQIEEGWHILLRYYQTEILPQGVLKPPLSTEGRVQGSLQVHGVEFKLTGRYDRLDVLEQGLHLIDYKSSKQPVLPSPETVDLQLGLYALALEQRYGQLLCQMSLFYLRTGEQVTYAVTPIHKQQVKAVIGDLALSLKSETDWQPKCGEQCRRCTYARYCAATQTKPEPLPLRQPRPRRLQLCLNV